MLLAPASTFPPTCTYPLSFPGFVNLDAVDKMGCAWNNVAMTAYGHLFVKDLGDVTVEQRVFCSLTLGCLPLEGVPHPPVPAGSCKGTHTLTGALDGITASAEPSP